MIRMIAAVALLAATPAAAQTHAPVDYAKDSNWLCLPGRSDVCSAPQSTATVV